MKFAIFGAGGVGGYFGGRLAQAGQNVMASMQKDVMEGRSSELDAQIGALIRMARMADLSVPTNEFIYASLLPMEKKALGM